MEGGEYLARELEDELKRAEYPIHFLDFETLAPAIPRYAGTSPYQTIPFQWSDHIVHPDGTINHKEYLCGEDKDPREEFARTLLEVLGERGTIFIYTTYEEGIMKGLAEDLPAHRGRLLALLERFRDLHAGIRRYFYHPEFHGSFSLKAVLPPSFPRWVTKTWLATMMEATAAKAKGGKGVDNAFDDLHNQLHALMDSFCGVTEAQAKTPAYDLAVTNKKEVGAIFRRLWKFKDDQPQRDQHLDLLVAELKELRETLQQIK